MILVASCQLPAKHSITPQPKCMPQVNQFCKVIYEGRLVNAKVTSVTDSHFDVLLSFGESMSNIPNSKFRGAEPDLGSMIINLINKDLNLNLKTVDAASFSEDINALIVEKKWMIN